MSTTLVALVLLSAALHATWNAILKRVGGDQGVIWVSQLIGVALALPVASRRLAVAPLAAADLGWLAVAGVIQGVYFALLGRAYARGDLSVIYPLARGGGVALAALASAVVFGDPLSWGTLAGVAAVCAGTVLLGAGDRAPDPTAVALALAVAVSLGVGTTVDKLALGHLDPAVYAVGQFLAAVALAAPVALTRGRAGVRRALTEHRGAAAWIGALSMLSYGLALLAFRDGPLAVAVALRETSVVFGAGIGVVAFGELPTRRRLAGIGVVLAGLVLLRLG